MLMKGLVILLGYAMIVLVRQTLNHDSPHSIVDTFHLVSLTQSCYDQAVSHFGERDALLFPNWSLIAAFTAGDIHLSIQPAFVISSSLSESWLDIRVDSQQMLEAYIAQCHTMSTRPSVGLSFGMLGSNDQFLDISIADGYTQAYAVKVVTLDDGVNIARISWLLCSGLASTIPADAILRFCITDALQKQDVPEKYASVFCH
ncbi:hypothetical protein NLI96_g5412 [Meripilus lineatus]|uniref:Uncharacterized protein n=1 Tax=Meripilus lineatus TaxID=2056292 RepID=A0AAD5YJ10_9APHY|nr:hypothetical protein NLI96_g5412 [Physisporinus lineatus]